MDSNESSKNIGMEVLNLALKSRIYEAYEMARVFDDAIEREYKEGKEKSASLAAFIASRKV